MRRWQLIVAADVAVLVLLGLATGVRSQFFLGAFALSAFLGLLLATVLTFPSLVARLDQGTSSPPSDLVKARNDVRTALLQGFASILLLVGAGVAFSQLRTSQRELETTAESQQTERFSRAVDQLAASTGRSVRLGGIYTLIDIARQDSRQRSVVADILAAYVQENAPRPPAPAAPTEDQPVPLTLTMPDVQASLDFLATQPVRRGLLAGLLLDHVALPGVRFADDQAQLEAARLRNADLTGASIVGGRLAGADLTEASLSNANLTRADLGGAALGLAHMVDVNLTGADLGGAELSGADLHGANLAGASLRGAVLVGADLSSAAHITGDLTRADLRHADLRAADLRFARGLLDADLTGAACDPDRTLLPAGLRCTGGLLVVTP